MAGQERHKVAPLLYLYCVDIVRGDDLYIRYLILHQRPYIIYVHEVADLKLIEIQKIRVAVPPAMTCNYGIGVDAADRDARLSQHCRSVCHVLIVRSEIQRQCYLKLWDIDYPECLILQAVLREDECGLLVCRRVCERYLLTLVQPSIILLYVLSFFHLLHFSSQAFAVAVPADETVRWVITPIALLVFAAHHRLVVR